jgi:hypothetical protein
MGIRWGVTFDCADAAKVARFWALALGYIEKPPPAGFESWEEWFARHHIPMEEWDEGAYLSDPDGHGPDLSFLQVPESKVVKNRVHLDVHVGGGRATPLETRWPRVMAAVERLTAAGASVVRLDEVDGQPDHMEMADPEGNEFCLV